MIPLLCVDFNYLRLHTKLNSVALVRERTIPTERPPPVGEVSANSILQNAKEFGKMKSSVVWKIT